MALSAMPCSEASRRASGDERTGPVWRPFPPQDPARHHAARHHVLAEIRHVVVSSSRGRVVPRGVKRKRSHFPLRPRRPQRTTRRRTLHVIVRHRPPKRWSRRPKL